MNVREAYVTLIDALREHHLDESPRVAKALRVLEKKAESLRQKAERRALARPCPRACGRTSYGLLCWHCWQLVPPELKENWEKAGTVDERREACRAIYECTVVVP